GLDYNAPTFSMDGRSLLISSTRNPPRACIIGLRKAITVFFAGMRDWQLYHSPPLPSRHVYRVVESVAARQDGVALCGRKNRWRKLSLDSDGKLRISNLASPGPALNRQSFSGQYNKTKHGCSLQTIRYPDGSRVFLD